MIKRMFLALAITGVMAGCSSVKLDDVPVENKSPTTLQNPPGAGGQSNVAPVVTATRAGRPTWRESSISITTAT